VTIIPNHQPNPHTPLMAASSSSSQDDGPMPQAAAWAASARSVSTSPLRHLNAYAEDKSCASFRLKQHTKIPAGLKPADQEAWEEVSADVRVVRGRVV
jgi:hypothetical protein